MLENIHVKTCTALGTQKGNSCAEMVIETKGKIKYPKQKPGMRRGINHLVKITVPSHCPARGLTLQK